MNKTKLIRLIFVLSMMVSGAFVYPQSNTTYDFLKLDIGARASALGGSFTSSTNDVNTIFYNPAALSTLINRQASVGFFTLSCEYEKLITIIETAMIRKDLRRKAFILFSINIKKCR